jgi:hypothetical protein
MARWMGRGKGLQSGAVTNDHVGVNPSGTEEVEDEGKAEKGKSKGKGKGKAKATGKARAMAEEEPKKEKEKGKVKRKPEDRDEMSKPPKRRWVVMPTIVPESEAEADNDNNDTVNVKLVSKKAGTQKAKVVEQQEPTADDMEVDEGEESEEEPVPSQKVKGKVKAMQVKGEPADAIVLDFPNIVAPAPCNTCI